MGRAPCCLKVGMQKGPWTAEEDEALIQYIKSHGEGNWRNLPKNAGLLRCGKSCRLRWMNYLRPDIKRGNINPEEEDLIIRLHKLLGNRWSLIAGRLPGRTDNEIKNYWNSHLSKKLKPERKPRSSRTKKKEEHKVTRKTEVEVTHKIHVPKPTKILRISSMTESCEGSDCMNRASISEDKEHASVADFDIDWSVEDKGHASVDNFDIDWSGFEDGCSFLSEQARIGHVNHGCGVRLDNSLFGSLYLEYSQLLNSDEDQLHMYPFSHS